MKRQIRMNVFETNSSSMHSLVIMKRNDNYTPEELLEGIYLTDDKETGEKSCVWKPWEGDMRFGRAPFRPLRTFADKWLYACASLVSEYGDETYKKLVVLAEKYIPGLKKIKLPKDTGYIFDKNDKESENDEDYQKYGKTEEELQEYLLQKEKEWGFETEYWNSNGFWHFYRPFTGDIDEDILSGFLEHEGISLEEYLTNKKYVVIQDGDEYCYWEDMKESGLVNMSMIESEYPRRD